MKTTAALLLVFSIGHVVTASRPRECSSGPLGKSVALLANYAPAQMYCSAEFENVIPAATITVTSCSTEPTSQPKRDTETHEREELSSENTTDSSSEFSETTIDAATAFAKIKRARTATQRTFCSCIETPPKPHIISILASCSKAQFCSPTGICKPKRNCRNPARCSSDSYCLEAAAGACFCHPDTENPNLGYCMSAGPGGKGCPDFYEDCSSNAQCGGARVCIYACCREEPFCVDLGDYDPGTPNLSAPKRLFRKESGEVGWENEGLVEFGGFVRVTILMKV